MCNFEFNEYAEVLQRAFKGDTCDLHLDNRLRLKCDVSGGESTVKQVYLGNNLMDSETMDITDFHVVNEVVIDRGPSPYSL